MASKVLVVGSGCIGLRTALELLRKNIPVVLKSAFHPLDPKTCSMGAGGLWMPFKCNDARVDKWARATLDELMAISAASSPPLPSTSPEQSSPLVEIVPTLYLTSAHRGPTVEQFKNFNARDYVEGGSGGAGPDAALPSWTKDPRLSFQHLAVEMLEWQNQVLRLKIPSLDTLRNAGYKHAWLFRPPIVDAPRMLSHMLREIQDHPLATKVDVEMEKEGQGGGSGGSYQSIHDMIQDAHDHDCDGLVNCTGLGSAKLCNDEDLMGGRGVLLHYHRSCARTFDEEDDSSTTVMKENDAVILVEDAPWGSYTDPAYIIPRGDVFVVGGTYYENNAETDVSHEERQRLVENAALMGIDTSKASPIGEWVGFRPVRQNVRMEVDERLSSPSSLSGKPLRVVHSYGHGGSGWTTYAGVAKEAADLLLKC